MTLNTDTQRDTSQIVMIPQEEGRPSLEKIRSDLNLEKWSIWQPSKSKAKPKERVLRREVLLPDGSSVTAEVEVGFTNKGALTTEDQKTFYTLIKIWEDKGRPKEQTFYSSRSLAKVLHKGWGTNVIEANSQSLMRLRITPFIWRNSYHNSARKEVVEQLDPFNILSDLKIIRTAVDGHITKEYGYFKFNDFILNNLLNNHTKPLLLEVVLGFKSEIAQMLYTHLDLIMARRDHYERRTRELFDDLGLDSKEYLKTSSRTRKLRNALKELKGARLTTGVITTATLKRTKDDKDFKLVIRKSSRMPLAFPQHIQVDPESGGVAAFPTQPVAASDPLTAEAKALVAHFYKRFHNTETSYPTSKAINQAIALIAYHGLDQARHIVDFSYHAAPETNYKPQTFGGILQYASRALADYDQAQRRKDAEAQKREVERRAQEEDQLRRQYEHYRRERLAAIRATTPPDTLTAIEQAAITQFDRDNTNPYGRDLMRRLAIDNALAAHFALPSLEAWRATHNRHKPT